MEGESIAREGETALVCEYVSRASRLAPLLPRLRPLPEELRLAYQSPHNLALELTKSILYDGASADSLSAHSPDSLWNGRPQHYFESMQYGGRRDSAHEYDSDSLAP